MLLGHASGDDPPPHVAGPSSTGMMCPTTRLHRAAGSIFMPIAVIDFETTGSSPNQGARATEIAAVLMKGDRIVDQYQSLMYSGAWVPPFIEQLTGITFEMLADAPPAEQIMGDVLRFTSGYPDRERFTYTNQEGHLGPTLFAGGAARALHLRMIDAMQCSYRLNINCGLHLGTWSLTDGKNRMLCVPSAVAVAKALQEVDFS